MSDAWMLIPLIPIIGLLIIRQHMLIAGAVGGITAMVLGGIGIQAGTGFVLDGINQLMSITVPILYAATAALVARAGATSAIVTLAERRFGKRISLLAGFMVLVQALATYTAGLGAGNTMVTAPLVFAAVGAIPHVIAGMAIVTAVSFTTSQASTETVVTAEFAGVELAEHASNMLPFTLLFWAVGIGLAIYGVAKHGGMLGNSRKVSNDDAEELTTGQLWKLASPGIALLVMVVSSGRLNDLVGTTIFTPVTIVVFTVMLTYFLTPLNWNETAEGLVQGSQFIVVTLFSVGVFLGFINILGEIGTFELIASWAELAPEPLLVPVAVIIAFIVAIPAGAFTAGVLTLVLPTLSVLGLSSEALGLVAIAAGLGTQVSPVQINVAALASGFDKDVMQIVRGNIKFVGGALGLVLLLSVGLFSF
jgi:hypothetical protein